MKKIEFWKYDRDEHDGNKSWMFAYVNDGPFSLLEYIKYNDMLQLWL